MKNLQPLPSDDGWCFDAYVDGDDIVIPRTSATWFGGDDDPLDNGETASGIKTAGNPDCLGCALPVVASHPSTKGSPVAFAKRIPWHTRVEVTAGDKTIVVPLIDNGPAKSARDGIDLTVAAFKYFAPIKQGVIKEISVRILGARKYVPQPLE